jgi:hypothetical protein
MLKWFAVLTLLLAGVVAGCGGGGTSYSLEDTVSCLRTDGVQVSTDDDDLDYVAQDAGEGALYAEMEPNSVTVVFERTAGDAKNTEAAYKLFAGAFDTSVEDTLQRHGNAVVLWDKTPTEDEATQVEDCLGA